MKQTKIKHGDDWYYICPIALNDSTVPLYIPEAKRVDYCNERLCDRWEYCPSYNTMIIDKIRDLKNKELNLGDRLK